MSYKTLRRFTCDRCDAVEEVPSTEQPTGWSSVIVVEPMLLATPDDRSRIHLCNNCTDTVLKVLEGEEIKVPEKFLGVHWDEVIQKDTVWTCNGEPFHPGLDTVFTDDYSQVIGIARGVPYADNGR